MNSILSFFKLTPEALAKWIATGIGALAGHYIAGLSPGLQGPADGLITSVSGLAAAWLANFLHLSPSPNASTPAPAPVDPAK